MDNTDAATGLMTSRTISIDKRATCVIHGNLVVMVVFIEGVDDNTGAIRGFGSEYGHKLSNSESTFSS